MMTRVINKLETSLTDDARVVIYNHHMFIELSTKSWGKGEERTKMFLD